MDPLIKTSRNVLLNEAKWTQLEDPIHVRTPKKKYMLVLDVGVNGKTQFGATVDDVNKLTNAFGKTKEEAVAEAIVQIEDKIAGYRELLKKAKAIK